MGELAQWLTAARGGSREALGQAFDAFRRYLLIVAQRELDPDLQAKGSASDLVQETFLEAQRDFGQFHGDSAAAWKAWLRQLLLNNLANFTRTYRATAKRDVHREVAIDPAGSAGARGGDPFADVISPSGLAVKSEQAQSLLRALEQLPEDYRRVILLRYQQQQPFDEIARLMNRTSNAVRILWSRAVRRLRQMMENSHDEQRAENK
jgi:RNA polymerase sigma-70 factor (ECF subfamily)